jgi:hypothetical protein
MAILHIKDDLYLYHDLVFRILQSREYHGSHLIVKHEFLSLFYCFHLNSALN